jgi:hypothetical protein
MALADTVRMSSTTEWALRYRDDEDGEEEEEKRRKEKKKKRR